MWYDRRTRTPAGSRFDTELDVYAGPSLLELEEVYWRADGRRGRVALRLQGRGGDRLPIAVGAAYRGNKGLFTLRRGRYP
jgi:hypothetical protein